MADQVIEQQEVEIPDWIKGMKFCHLVNGNEEVAICGHRCKEPGSCGIWLGEAFCDQCGQPLCPRCVQLSELEDRLQDD